MRRAEVLALLCLGFGEDDVATTLHIALSTARNHAVAIRREVVPRALRLTRANAVAWGWLHSGCCLATALVAVVRDHRPAADRLSQLAAHHVGVVPRRQLDVLTLEAFGLSACEAAEALALSGSSMRSASNAARQLVAPPEITPARDAATAWWHLHVCILHRDRGSRFGEIWRKGLQR